MIWFKLIFSLVFVAIQCSGSKAGPNFQAEITFSCIHDERAEELRNFELRYDPDMSIQNFKFQEGEIEKLQQLIGAREKILFFFLGHEDKLRSLSRGSYQIAQSQLVQTGAAVCYCSYAFLTGPDILKYVQYFDTLEYRLPKVVDMISSFISNIVDSNKFKVTLPSVTLTGFCLGGHIAGQVGHKLKSIYKGKKVASVWAFDPPTLGFSVKKGVPRRVQKGDGKIVVVFHTSTMGVTKCHADIDILVNGGESQPGCQFEMNKMLCSHFAGFILREIIITKKIFRKEYFPYNENDMPFAHNNKNETIELDFTDPPYGKSGIYHMKTGMVFETHTKGFFQRLFSKKEEDEFDD